MVPRILHQTWKDHNLPPHFALLQEWWRAIYPDFDYQLHTDEDNDWLVKSFFPEYWDFYQALPHKIQKVDVSRLLWLHKVGGMYADLDVVPHQRLDARHFLKNALYYEPFGSSKSAGAPWGNAFNRRDLVCNYVMLFETESKFVKVMMDEMVEHHRWYKYTGHKATDVCSTTGCVFISDFVNKQRTGMFGLGQTVVYDSECWDGKYGTHEFASTWHAP